ncbi:MAG: DNA-processing protein DprA [Eubacterium sp.]|nr:DNA-processing protein DprA [Eubacterium sp.]
MNYCLWLSYVWEIGGVTSGRMIEAGLGAEDVYKAGEDALRSLEIFDKKQLSAIEMKKKEFDFSREEYMLAEKGIDFYCKEKGPYPERLRYIFDSPYSLFVRGKLPDEETPAVAVVGARSCSPYGKAVSREIGEGLAGYGINVISGMALGIDGESQKGALSAGGKTYAVLGSGVDICYPSGNRRLYDEVRRQCGVISEFYPGTVPQGWNFVLRNRIISGLSDCVIVVEAKAKSGSLITAEYALQQGRDLYAVPGYIDQALSRGCNRLIRQGAGIFVSVDDFVEDVSFFEPFSSYLKGVNSKNNSRGGDAEANGADNFKLVKSESVVYSSLNLLPKSLEEIGVECSLPPRELIKAVSSLCSKGLIYESAKGRYSRKKMG